MILSAAYTSVLFITFVLFSGNIIMPTHLNIQTMQYWDSQGFGEKRDRSIYFSGTREQRSKMRGTEAILGKGT